MVHLHVVDKQFCIAISTATAEMGKAGLQLHTFGATVKCSNDALPQSFKPLAGAITILCTGIKTLMNAPGYRCHRGNIFRNVPESVCTYSCRGTMKSFLHKCTSNDSLKDRMVRHMSKLLQKRMLALVKIQDVWLLAQDCELIQLAKEVEDCNEEEVRQAKHYLLDSMDPKIGLEVRRQAKCTQKLRTVWPEACAV